MAEKRRPESGIATGHPTIPNKTCHSEWSKAPARRMTGRIRSRRAINMLTLSTSLSFQPDPDLSGEVEKSHSEEQLTS